MSDTTMAMGETPVTTTWDDVHGYVCGCLRGRLRDMGGFPRSRVDDVVADALPMAWEAWERSVAKGVDPLLAARRAARASLRNVLRGNQWASTREHKYVDALDRRDLRDAAMAALARDSADPVRSLLEGVERFRALEALLSRIPQDAPDRPRLVQLGRLLGYGRSMRNAFETMGLSWRDGVRLAIALAGYLPQELPQEDVPEGLADDDEPVRRFRPVRRLVTALEASLEHNLCSRPDVIVHVDAHTGHVVLESR